MENGKSNGTVSASDELDPAVPLLSLLRKHKARIAEYEQIASEAMAALTEARRTFALAQRQIAKELGISVNETKAPAKAVTKLAPIARRARKSSLHVSHASPGVRGNQILKALSDGKARKLRTLANEIGATAGSVVHALPPLIDANKVARIGRGIYQTVKA